MHSKVRATPASVRSVYVCPSQPCYVAELSKSHGSRQTFMQQQHESELVLQVRPGAVDSAYSVPHLVTRCFMQELELLDEDSNIYKLIGPVLIKQDPLEAKTNVKKRLEFIKGESDRLDAQCKRLQDKQHKRQSAVSCPMQLQLPKSGRCFVCGLLSALRTAQAGFTLRYQCLSSMCRFGSWSHRFNRLYSQRQKLKQCRYVSSVAKEPMTR